MKGVPVVVGYALRESLRRRVFLVVLILTAAFVVLYWLGRVWLLAHRGLVHEDPLLFALRDRVSWVVGAAMAVTLWLAA